MKTISSQEIKRRGISAVDEDLKDGPVHVIKNNKLKYVIMDQEKYSELVSESEASYDKRLIKALDEIERGEIQTHDTINDLIDGKYNIIDEHYDKHSYELNDIKQCRYSKFRNLYDDNNKAVTEELQEQCEYILLNSR